MDFFQDNYFDIIALPLPSLNQFIQPSSDFPVDASSCENAFYHEFNGDEELPSYTELTTSPYTLSSSSNDDQSMAMTELDQFLIFDCDDSFTVTTFDNLPDQTLMCTDSCMAFLKESSEILRVNSLKIQQKDEVLLSSEEIKSDEKVFFTCNFGDCKKTYLKHSHLKGHVRRHLGLKPYFCNFPNCSWKFSRSDELGKWQVGINREIFLPRASYFRIYIKKIIH